MAVTATTFVARFPEFGTIETSVVTATVAEAGRQCDSDLWGDKHDDAVNYLYDPLHPSVLRLVRNIIQAGKAAGIPVSMCGEMAGDPLFTRLLMGLGLRQFSMEPSQLLEIRQQVRQTRLSAVPEWIERILECTDTNALHGLVDQLNAQECV